MRQAVRKRAVVITGASTGIGEACALYLCERGFQVFAGVRREVDGAALLLKCGANLTPLELDVTNASSLENARQVVVKAVGSRGLHGLVNNAGVARAGPLETLPIEDVRLQMEVNVIGAIAVTQAFIPSLRTGRGRIVNIGSINGLCALPFVGAYAATKFALEAVSEALRVELKPWRIAVSQVDPGDIETPIRAKTLAAADERLRTASPEALEQLQRLYGPVVEFMRNRAVTARGIAPEHVARVVARALTARRPRSRYLVGRDARMMALLERLPDPVRDRIIISQLPRYGGRVRNS